MHPSSLGQDLSWGKIQVQPRGCQRAPLPTQQTQNYTKLYQSLDNTSSISYLHKQEISHFLFAPWHRADTTGASPLGTALMDVQKLPSEYSQLFPRAFWGLGACSVHRGSQKCWRVASAGSSPPLKTNETLWITIPASLPAQVGPLQGVLCTVSQRPQWVQVSVALHGTLHRKACCLDLLSQPDSLPTSLKSLPGVSSQINHLHLNFLSWGLHLGGGGEGVNSNKCSYVCHFIIVQKWMVAKEALQRLISKLVPGASRPHGSSSHPGLVISVWGLKEALILVVFTLWPLIDIRALIPNKWLLTTEEAESVEPSSESPYWWPVRMINTGVFSPHCLTDPWWDLPGATRDLFWPPPQSILLTPSS